MQLLGIHIKKKQLPDRELPALDLIGIELTLLESDEFLPPGGIYLSDSNTIVIRIPSAMIKSIFLL